MVSDDSVTFSDTALPTVFSTVTVTDTESALADLTIALETNTYFELDGCRLFACLNKSRYRSFSCPLRKHAHAIYSNFSCV